MKPLGLVKARFFLRKYMWLVRPTEDVVVDFVRAARLGEAPWLTICGSAGTGKTRLATLIGCLAPDTVVVEGDEHGEFDLAATLGGQRPVVWATKDRDFVKATVGLGPGIFLPKVWRPALVQENVALVVDVQSLKAEAEGLWQHA